MTKRRLELTWFSRNMALIPTETGKDGYTCVDPTDSRSCGTHALVTDQYIA